MKMHGESRESGSLVSCFLAWRRRRRERLWPGRRARGGRTRASLSSPAATVVLLCMMLVASSSTVLGFISTVGKRNGCPFSRRSSTNWRPSVYMEGVPRDGVEPGAKGKASQPAGRSNIESRRLTVAMGSYPDNPDAVLGLTEQHMDRLNHINIVAALKSLANGNVVHVEDDPRFKALLGKVQLQLASALSSKDAETWGPLEVSKLVLHLSRLWPASRPLPSALVESLHGRIAQLGPSLSPEQLSVVLTAIAKAPASHHLRNKTRLALLDQLVEQVGPRLRDFPPKALCSTASALARLSGVYRPEPELLVYLCEASEACVEDFSPQELARLLPSLPRLCSTCASPSLLTRCRDAVMGFLHKAQQQQQQQQHSPLVEAVTEGEGSKASSDASGSTWALKPLDLISMLHGLSALQKQQQQQDGPMADEEQDKHIALERAVVEYLLTGPTTSRLTLKELTDVVVAMPRLQQQSPSGRDTGGRRDLMSFTWRVVEQAVRQRCLALCFEEDEDGIPASAIALLQAWSKQSGWSSPTYDTWQALLSLLTQRPPAVGRAEEVATLLHWWRQVKQQHPKAAPRPPRDLLQALEASLGTQPHVRALSSALQAFADFDYVPALLLAPGKDGLSVLGRCLLLPLEPPQLVWITGSLARFKWRLEGQDAEALEQALRTTLPSFRLGGLAAVLWAMSRVGYQPSPPTAMAVEQWLSQHWGTQKQEQHELQSWAQVVWALAAWDMSLPLGLSTLEQVLARTCMAANRSGDKPQPMLTWLLLKQALPVWHAKGQGRAEGFDQLWRLVQDGYSAGGDADGGAGGGSSKDRKALRRVLEQWGWQGRAAVMEDGWAVDAMLEPCFATMPEQQVGVALVLEGPHSFLVGGQSSVGRDTGECRLRTQQLGKSKQGRALVRLHWREWAQALKHPHNQQWAVLHRAFAHHGLSLHHYLSPPAHDTAPPQAP